MTTESVRYHLQVVSVDKKSRISHVSWGFGNIVYDLNEQTRDEILSYYLSIAQDSYTDYTDFGIELLEKYTIGENKKTSETTLLSIKTVNGCSLIISAVVLLFCFLAIILTGGYLKNIILK